MSRGACTFRQSDVTKLIKAARAAGENNVRVEVSAGKIVLMTSAPDSDVVDEKPEDLRKQI